jgi:hypothetical protein
VVIAQVLINALTDMGNSLKSTFPVIRLVGSYGSAGFVQQGIGVH